MMSFSINDTLIDELREEYFLPLDISKIKLALENGADANIVLCEDGSTALHILSEVATEEDCVFVAPVLLAHDANPNIQNKLGWSSVHIAASLGYCEFLELLLVNGGDPLLGDIRGLSPIDVAYQNNQMDALNLLNLLLDSETYDSSTGQPSDIVVSLWKREVVEIVPELPSCDCQEVNDSIVIYQKDKVHNESNLSQMLSLDHSEVIGSYVCFADSSNLSDSFYDQVGCQQQKNRNPETNLKAGKSGICGNPPNIGGKRYFEFLKKDLGCNTDSDSDADLIALQKCLRESLENGYPTEKAKPTSIPKYLDSYLEYSCDDHDIAQSDISVTSDGNCDVSLDFEGTYIPSDAHHFRRVYNGKTDASFHSKFNKSKLQQHEGQTYPQYADKQSGGSSNCKSNVVSYASKPSTKEMLQEIHTRMIGADANMTAPQNLTLPDCCTSFQLLRAPKKRFIGSLCRDISGDMTCDANDTAVSDLDYTEEESSLSITSWCHEISNSSASESLTYVHNVIDDIEINETAPQNMTRPDCCTSFHLLKAPMKKSFNETVTEILNRKNKKQNENFEGLNKDLNSLLSKQGFNIENRVHHLGCIENGNSSRLMSLSEYGTARSSNSSGCSCHSLVSVVEEFLYKDPEAGITLIERRCPTSATLTSLLATGNRTVTLTKTLTPQRPLHNVNEDVPDSAKIDHSLDSLGTLTGSIKAMGGEQLRKKLMEIGFTPGPVLPSTRRVYQRHLLRLRKHPELLDKDNVNELPEYSRELRSALTNPSSVNWQTWIHLEKTMCSLFSQPDPSRYWRDGTNKTCFNYLLLDPRTTQDLPIRGMLMDEDEVFKCFISAIFYIGKGSRGRPYYHLYEAMNRKETKRQKNEKVKRIQEIWSEGVGVVSLHVFQNTIPVEAWTREAAMISAVGLKNLCNSIKGTFYGVASTWKGCEQRRLGTLLLQRALKIFMLEGERQLRPCDVTPPAWFK